MDGIEKAIRSALAKGDDRDRAFRERVYRQAFAALDRALKQNPGATVEAAIRRKQDLQARIIEIEQQYIAPAAPRRPAEAAPELGRPEPVRPEADRAEPGRVERDAARRSPAPTLDVAPERRAPQASAPAIDAAERRDPGRTAADDALPRAEERPVPQRRRRPWAAILVTIAIVAAVIGLWWVGSGFFESAERDPIVEEAPPALQEENAQAEGATQAPALPSTPDTDRDWITVFDPADPTSAAAAGGASAEVLQEEGETFLRISSGEAGDPVRFDVGQGVLEEIAGRSAVFVIDARAEEGQPTQIAVECDFGALGDCGRKRYIVGQERSDFLFEIELPDGAPGAGGTIAVNSDVEGQGRSVDVFGIRAAVEE